MLTEVGDFEKYPYDLPFDVRNEREVRLCQCIEINEPWWMRYAFGDNFYILFRDGLAAGTPDQRWVNLRDGVEWAYNSKNYIFDGVRPLIRPYIFYHYLRSETSITTLQGQRQATSEHAEAISPAYVMQARWSEMIEGICKMYDFLSLSGDYPEWELCDTRADLLLSLPNAMDI